MIQSQVVYLHAAAPLSMFIPLVLALSRQPPTLAPAGFLKRLKELYPCQDAV